MKFPSAIVLSIAISLVLACMSIRLLDQHIHRVVVSTLQEITAAPR
jgi:hypothetical protein